MEQFRKLSASLTLQDLDATLSTLKRIFDNIIQHPNDDKYRQIKLTSKKFSSKVWQYPAGELMKMSGWVVEDDHVRLIDDSCVQILSQLLGGKLEKKNPAKSTHALNILDSPSKRPKNVGTVCEADASNSSELLHMLSVSPATPLQNAGNGKKLKE